jgi:hypothetical protein
MKSDGSKGPNRDQFRHKFYKMFRYIMNLANGMNQNMQLWDSENPWRATLKSHTNIIFKRNDLPINITTPWRIFLEVIYDYKSESTKISEFLVRNKDPYTWEIRMKWGTGRNKHMHISWALLWVYIYLWHNAFST